MLRSAQRTAAVFFAAGVTCGGLVMYLATASFDMARPSVGAERDNALPPRLANKGTAQDGAPAHLPKDIGRRMGLSDPLAGWSQGMALGNQADRLEFLEALLRSWAGKDPQGALAQVAELQPGRFKTQCLAAACAGWAQRDPPCHHYRSRNGVC